MPGNIFQKFTRKIVQQCTIHRIRPRIARPLKAFAGSINICMLNYVSLCVVHRSSKIYHCTALSEDKKTLHNIQVYLLDVDHDLIIQHTLPLGKQSSHYSTFFQFIVSHPVTYCILFLTSEAQHPRNEAMKVSWKTNVLFQLPLELSLALTSSCVSLRFRSQFFDRLSNYFVVCFEITITCPSLFAVSLLTVSAHFFVVQFIFFFNIVSDNITNKRSLNNHLDFTFSHTNTQSRRFDILTSSFSSFILRSFRNFLRATNTSCDMFSTFKTKFSDILI